MRVIIINKKHTFFLIVLAISITMGCKEDEIKQSTTLPCEVKDVINDKHPKADELDQLVQEAIDRGLVGLSMIVKTPEGIYEKQGGLANLEKSIPMRGCHSIRIASLTKTVLATAILLLVEDGKLNLNDRMNLHLLDGDIEDIPGADSVMIEQLLNHTSGIPNYDDDSRFPALILNQPGAHISLEEKLDLVRGDDRIPAWVVEKFEYIYANTNYLLLQLILERVSGKSFEGFVMEYIFNPLGIFDVHFGRVNFFPSSLATGYVDFYGNNTIRNVQLWDAGRFDAEGNLIMTAYDVYMFFFNLLEGNIVSPQTLKLMREKRLGFLNTTFGDLQAFGHDGIAIGYSSEMWHLPEANVTVVMLANQGRLIEETSQVMLFEDLLVDVINKVNL